MSRLVAQGGKVLLDEASLWPDGKFVMTNIVVRQEFLDEHPKAVEAVLRASVASNRWINAHPEEAKEAADAARGRHGQAAAGERPRPGLDVDHLPGRPAGRHPQDPGRPRRPGPACWRSRT
ncbi:hypothetical protein SALBM217S_00951 [Streptomyces griseoloalbus]